MNHYNPIQSDLFSSFDTTPVQANSTPAETTSAPTLDAFADKVGQRLWPKTHTYNHNMRGIRWFADFAGQLPMDQIRRKHIYDFLDHLMDTRGITQNSANKYMAAISRVLSYANEREIIDNPIKLKYENTGKGRPKVFTREEQDELVRYLRDDCDKAWMADMVILSCNTGMRRGEIIQLNAPGVDLSPCGKWLHLPEEVCKAGEREVPLNTEARAAYERLLPVIDKVWSHRTFYWFWNKAKRDVGKRDPNFVFHVCRHTAASRLANDVQLNEFAIADIMGHADTRTTRRYVHSRKSTLLAGVEQL